MISVSIVEDDDAVRESLASSSTAPTVFGASVATRRQSTPSTNWRPSAPTWFSWTSICLVRVVSSAFAAEAAAARRVQVVMLTVYEDTELIFSALCRWGHRVPSQAHAAGGTAGRNP